MRSIKKYFEVFIIIFIILFGSFLYFHKLDSIPNGLYVDEAIHGYKAYSLLNTSKDEFGKKFPILLKIFGSFNPPLYTYLSIPFVALFGLSTLGVRYLAAASGTIAIILVFFFLKSLNIAKSKVTIYLGTLLFTISPWVILYNRSGLEITLAFLIFYLGVFLFWLGLQKPVFLIPGSLFISISTYASYSNRFIGPLFILGLILIFRKRLFVKSTFFHLLAGGVIFILFQIPYLSIISTEALFTKTDLLSTNQILNQAEKISHFLPDAMSFPLSFIREFLAQYLTYFSPRSLFNLSDPDPQRSIPDLSVFYSWMIIPYLVGFYSLLKNLKKDSHKFILFIALIGPIPAALTHDPFATHRAYSLVLPLIVIITLGIDRLIYKKHFLTWVVLILIFYSLVLLWRSYFVFLPKERAKVWGYGFSQLADEIKRRPYQKFIIDQGRSKPAYIELAFFLNFPPEKFQEIVDQRIKDNYYSATSFTTNYKFANIETRNLNWENDIYENQILVGDEFAISSQQVKEHSLTKIFEIRDPINQMVFQGFKTNPKEKCSFQIIRHPQCKKNNDD